MQGESLLPWVVRCALNSLLRYSQPWSEHSHLTQVLYWVLNQASNERYAWNPSLLSMRRYTCV